MRYFIIFALLCSPALAQSITVSGGRQSIVLSGKADAVSESVFVEQVPEQKVDPEIAKLRQEIARLQEQIKNISESQPTAKASATFTQKQLPVFEIWTTSGCPPCAQLKSDIASGKLFGVGVIENSGPPPFPGSGYPQCRINGQSFIGWNSSTLSQVRTIAGLDQVQQSIPVPAQRYQQPVRQRRRLPIVNTQWGTIDLETYQRNCNCPMCQGIRALQQQYRQTSFIEQSVPPAQEPTPELVLQDAVDLMSLQKSDILADMGCGDGRVLIAAVRKYGCRAIGVEIDPKKADEARANVYEAGLKGQIEIITGDATQFWPADHGVTAVFVYLYPDLLEKLKPNLQQVGLVVSPFHQVPGLEMERKGDVWIFRK
jgi:precorrin-6B methylase 2